MAERVVSLAPSATSIMRSLGCTDHLVGGTLHGDHEATVVGGWLNPDLDAVAALDPDLVITTDALQAPIVSQLRERDHRTLHLAPNTLSDVTASIERIGDALHAETTAAELISKFRADLRALPSPAAKGERPVVYCEEWSDPPMAAGNWVPELVAVAGGVYPFRQPGERSAEVTRRTVEQHQPEHVFLHICGKGDRVDPSVVLDRDWAIPAIERQNVWVIDDRLLNQPAPSLVRGARAIHERLVAVQ